MRNWLRKLVKAAAYAAAGIVILLAIAVGLFRLFLPRLPEYQDEIKAWASTAIGAEVEFSGMDARWGLRGPQLKFYDAELLRSDDQTRLVAAGEVGIGVSLVRLLVDRTLVVDTVTVSDTSIELRRLADNSWRVQGSAIDALPEPGRGDGEIGRIRLIGENIELQLIQPGDERPTFFEIPLVIVERDQVRIAIDADVRLPATIGRHLNLSATRLDPGEIARPWNIFVEADALDLAGVSALLPADLPGFGSGAGDIDAAIALDGRHIRSLSANLAFNDVSLGNGPGFGLRGHIAWSSDASGWLVAADELSLSTTNGVWPQSSLRLETGTADGGEIVMLDASASYLNLSDAAIVEPWLDEGVRAALAGWQPDGVVRDLTATLSDLDSESPRYSVSVTLDEAGVAASGRRPGVRGFSGSLRADHEGGLLEIDAEALTLDLGEWTEEPVDIALADGTVIWRHSATRTTVLSDSILIQNEFFDSHSNVEIAIAGDASPVIDLSSSWSIADIAAAKRYIPAGIMKPKLHQWFQDALVDGRMTRGTTRLNGPLDRFPFDGDEGRLLIEAQVEDMTFRYLPQFPAAEITEMAVVLDNTRLYTKQNRSLSTGNETVDAAVEIADLRQAVLTIDAFSTGTLDTIREFAASSPIGNVFGGGLERVSVAGDASLALDLSVPLTDWRSYAFTAAIRSNDGTLEIDGLDPPLTGLTGTVTIERELVSSEGLSGVFLGEPVAIELRNAAPDMPGFRVVATATGAATAAQIVDGFGLPLGERFDGRMDYGVDVLFPAAGSDTAAPLTVRVETDLAGIGSNLPPPFSKAADDLLPVGAVLTFPAGGGEIITEGRAANTFAWRMNIARRDQAWDFDRGMLVLGGGELEEAEVRGLHVRGRTPLLRLDDWLALSRGDGVNAAERIRSIDLTIDNLHLLGQHLRDHRVRVDRSARDWLVQFDGNDVSGSAFVPYEFSPATTLVLDMERLVLPGDPQAADARLRTDEPPLDPRRFPAIELRAAEFALGERYFGAIETDIARTPEGLVADSIVATDESFEIVGSGRWVSNESDRLGSRTSLTATLASSDVEATMRRLNYQPGIVSNDMGMLLDLSWSGGPGGAFLETLDGTVQVRLGSGQLDEVEPGAGRMFGLMSIVALPRRLSLDFRDVFQKGFGFDSISGTFRIEDGTAYTCDLSLEGPAADIGIIGRAELVERSYTQTAIVSAKVGNTLPVVGAIAAGPQVAAAMFLFSQIFKKPLQDIGQVYYGISGSWDDPAIENADAEAFAESGRLAGCLDETG